MKKIPEELFQYMEAMNDDDLSDGVWQQVLEDTVTFYNQQHNTTFDENSVFLAWLEWHENQGLNK